MLLVMNQWTGPEHRSKNLLLLGRWFVLAGRAAVRLWSSLAVVVLVFIVTCAVNGSTAVR